MRLGGSFSSGSGGSIGGGGGGSPRPQQESGSDQRQLDKLQREAEAEQRRNDMAAAIAAKAQYAQEQAAKEAEQQRLQQVEADRKAQEAAAYQEQQQLAQAQAAAEEKARFERAKQLAEQQELARQQQLKQDQTQASQAATNFLGIPFDTTSQQAALGNPNFTPGDDINRPEIGQAIMDLGSKAVENLSILGNLGKMQTKPEDPNNLSLLDKFKMSLDQGVRDPVTNEVIYSPFSKPGTASYMDPNTFNYQGVANPLNDIKSLSFFGGNNNNNNQTQVPMVGQSMGGDTMLSYPPLSSGIPNARSVEGTTYAQDPADLGYSTASSNFADNPIDAIDKAFSSLNKGGGFAPNMMTGMNPVSMRPDVGNFNIDPNSAPMGAMTSGFEEDFDIPLIDPFIEYDDTGMPITPLTPEQIYSGKYAYAQANADPIMGGDINYAEASNRVGRSAPQRAPSQMSDREYVAATNAGWRWKKGKGWYKVNLGRVFSDRNPGAGPAVDPVVQAAGDAQTTMYRPDQQVGAYDVPFSDRNPGSGKLSPNVADPQGFLKRNLMDGNVETMNRGGVAGVYQDAPLRKVMEMNRKIKPRGLTDEQFLQMQMQARARSRAAAQPVQRQRSGLGSAVGTYVGNSMFGPIGGYVGGQVGGSYMNDGGVVYANEGTPRTHNTISGMSKDVATPMGNFLDKFGLKSNLMRLLGYDANTQRTHKGLGAFDSYFPGYTEKVFKEDGPLAKSKTTTTTVKEEYDTEGAGPKNYTSANEMGRPFKVNPNAGMRHSLTTPMVMPDLPLSNPNR